MQALLCCSVNLLGPIWSMQQVTLCCNVGIVYVAGSPDLLCETGLMSTILDGRQDRLFAMLRASGDT